MPRWVSADWRSPGAGLANALRPHLLRGDEFTMLYNVWLRSGNIVKRGGSVTQGSQPDAAVHRWMAHGYDTAGSSIRNRLRFVNGKFQWLNSTTWTDIVSGTGFTATTYPVSVQYQDKVFVVDAVNTPQQITIAATPTIANWTTMPSGINPSWVVLHNNRLYIGNDTSTPHQVWMCDPGTPATFQATEFYAVPDNQNGNFPKIAVNCGKGFLLLCQDYLCYLTGDGPNSHRIWQHPRGAACVGWRTAVDMGDFGVIYLTERGLFASDGTSPQEPIDPYGKINWGDINLTTETDNWAVRYGDIYILFYRSKGDPGPSPTTTVGTVYFRSSTFYNTMSFVTRVTTASNTTATHYIAYDCRKKQFIGMGSGAYSCGAWEQYRSGDTQDLWVGSATTNGKTYKWDQPGTWQDDSVSYPCIIKTGSVAQDPFAQYTVDKVQVKASTIKSVADAAEVNVYFNGDCDETKIAWQKTINLGEMNTLGDDASAYEPVTELADQVVKNVRPDVQGAPKKGLDPQVEVRHTGSTEFEVRGISAVTNKARGEE